MKIVLWILEKVLIMAGVFALVGKIIDIFAV